MASLKQLITMPERLTGGHRLCSGCGESMIVRQVLMSTEHPVVVANATGCLEVCTTMFPHTAWQVPWIHCAFENAAATISGVEAAYHALKARGKIDEDVRFLAIGGDGGTYDIGFQALSGALERGHRMVYLCLNNEAYMNTGIQRSSATPKGTFTTTSPVGSKSVGKKERRKDLTACVAAHNIPYVAQVVPGRWNDLVTKAQKAFEAEGPAFLNALSPCPLGWRYDASLSAEISRLAVNACIWPLFEVVDGEWRLNYIPREKLPVEEYFRLQGRYQHLFAKGNELLLKEIQENVDHEWDRLLKRCGGAVYRERPAAKSAATEDTAAA
jgi:pyruvate ferredoxin oxidoreductase beta subunit